MYISYTYTYIHTTHIGLVTCRPPRFLFFIGPVDVSEKVATSRDAGLNDAKKLHYDVYVHYIHMSTNQLKGAWNRHKERDRERQRENARERERALTR